MPGCFLEDAVRPVLIGTLSNGVASAATVSADISLGDTDFTVPHPGRCTAVLTVGSSVGNADNTAVIQVAAGDGTNWARVGEFTLDADDASGTYSVYIDDGGNGPYLTVSVDGTGTTWAFDLTLEIHSDRFDESPLMNVGAGSVDHTTPSPDLPDLTN